MKRLSIGDIRVVIGSVLGIIGIFLLVCSFFTTSAEELAKSGGIHANLWAGLALLVVAIVMWAWAFVAPDGGKSTDSVDEAAHTGR
ncbi:hypothetical protein H8R18_06235 [Nanchangia anserum]|uniref:Uncharacterized protein n=1 Tax=Nanchangia anserum TaxID=2692125 RepID=A0A8I0G7A1_9ACTO|nr:hypothetical protein [Nanchangia anserum]MBD3689132.1 hypothetical protein [Nanchangia anserum]QOX81366.1 hypothetical protein H8R18_06235 [Nanchangia anserum]